MSDLFVFLNNFPEVESDTYSKEQKQKIRNTLAKVWAEAMDHVKGKGILVTEVYCNKKGVIDFWENVKQRPLTDEEKDSIEEGTYKFENYVPVKQY